MKIAIDPSAARMDVKLQITMLAIFLDNSRAKVSPQKRRSRFVLL
jgi:hypothetical protein